MRFRIRIAPWWSVSLLSATIAICGCVSTPNSPSKEASGARPVEVAVSSAQTPEPVADAPAAEPDSAAPIDGVTRRIELAEAIQIARDSNIDLALARAQHEIAQARAAASAKSLLPTLDAGGGIARTDGLVQGSFGDFREVESRSATAGVAIGFRANIGARVLEAMAARHQAHAAELDGLAAEQLLVLRVIDLFQDLVLAKVSHGIAEDLVESSEQFEHISSMRYEGGVGLGADVARARANVAANRQQVVQARRLWETTSIRLAAVLRLEPDVLLDPADTDLAPWQLPPDFYSAPYADAARNRPDVEANRESALASNDTLRARWWDLVAPELSAEWRLTGVGGDGATAEPDRGAALSSAAGSAGRSISAWQNVGASLTTQGGNPFAAISSAAGSSGRSAYAYHNLLGSTQQDIDELTRQERYGVWLNWNLSFAKAERIREQRAVLREAELRVVQSEDSAVAEATIAQRDIQAALQLIALANDEIAAAEENHRLSIARFTAGTAIAFEVLDAQDMLAEARLKLVRYTTELNVAQARLLTASGTMADTLPAIAAPAAR